MESSPKNKLKKRQLKAAFFTPFPELSFSALVLMVLCPPPGFIVYLPGHTDRGFGPWSSPSAVSIDYAGPPLPFPYQNKAINTSLPHWHVMKVNELMSAKDFQNIKWCGSSEHCVVKVSLSPA